ncbi:hypothetical protein GCM10008022_15700 [Paenibacillus hunanensis]|nr:hypothetical protein GCM10008022_15700 [Paenibacillus hunanensis]
MRAYAPGVNTAMQISLERQAELGWNHEPSALVPAGTCVLFCAFYSLYIIGGFIYVKSASIC